MGFSLNCYRFFPMVKIFFFVILLAACPVLGFAQIFGGNPPQQWMQIDHDSFRLIFPKGMETTAIKLAGLFSSLPVSPDNSSIGKFKKINFVVQNKTVQSNGYVGLGPYRSELMTVAPQNSFRLGLPWLNTLGIHEYRHVQQFNHHNRGIARLTGKVLGDDARALLNNTAIPNWFWEGDAVWYETKLTETGRGRLPWFYNNFRSLWLSNNAYSYLKLRNGSLKDLVPGHYELGYLLVEYGKNKFGNGFWEKVTADAAVFKGLVYPFQNAFYRHSGMRFKDFVREVQDHYKIAILEDNIKLDPDTSFNHFEGNRLYPQWINDSTLVYTFNSFSQNPAFIIKNIHTGVEKKITERYISVDEYFSYASGKLVYTAYKEDIRWGWKEYGEIVVADIETGRQKYITKKTRYCSPSFNKSADKIVLVHIPETGNHELRIINLSDSIVFSFTHPDYPEFAYPVFLDEEHILAVGRNETGRQTILKIEIPSKSFEQLLPVALNPVGFIRVDNDDIYFNRSDEGTDKIYVLREKGRGALQELDLNNKRPVYYPGVLQHNISWSVPTISGNHIIVAKTDSLSFKTVDKLDISDSFPGSTLGLMNKISEDSSAFYTIESYTSLTSLFNFHSIRPYASDPEYTLTLIGENILNNFISSVSAAYNRNEKSAGLGINFRYAGWWPQIFAGGEYNFSRKGILNGNTVAWNESSVYAGAQVPLNLSRGKYFTRLLIREQFHLSDKDFFGTYKDSMLNETLTYQHFHLRFTHQLRSATQHIYPRFAQTLTLQHRSGLGATEANQFLLSSALYFPGLSRNHSFVLYGAFHQRNENYAPFSNNFPFSRGYETANFRKMHRLGADYHFPVCYPDAGFAHIIYLMRVRAAGFFDYTRVFNEGLNMHRDFKSAGLEITFDTKWWNQVEFPIGFRWSVLMDQGIAEERQNRFEIILPVIFN